jgi:hypothetical protein
VDKPSIDNIAGWCEKGVTLSHARRLQQFEVADWLVQGTGLFPDATAAYDFAEQTFPDVARQTLINWVSVARQFPACIRIQSEWLTFSHYQVVLGIASGKDDKHCDERQRWLQQANDEKLTVAALRAAIVNQQYGVPAQPGAAPTPAGTPVPDAAPPVKKQPIQFLTAPVYRVLSRDLPKLQALAATRQTTPEALLVVAVEEYLAAHAEETAQAMATAKGKNDAWFQAQIGAGRERETQAARALANEQVKAWQAQDTAQRHADEQAKNQRFAAWLNTSELEQLESGANAVSRCFTDDEPLFAQMPIEQLVAEATA